MESLSQGISRGYDRLKVIRPYGAYVKESRFPVENSLSRGGKTTGKHHKRGEIVDNLSRQVVSCYGVRGLIRGEIVDNLWITDKGLGFLH